MSSHDYNFAASPYATETRADRVAQRIADAEAADFNSARGVIAHAIDEAIRALAIQVKGDSELTAAYADVLFHLQAARDDVPEER